MYITFLIYDGLRERAPPQLEHWGDHVGDSLLTLHCHYLAITLPLHCHYIAITLPLPCHYLAITLPLYCHYIAIILSLHCHYIGIYIILHYITARALGRPPRRFAAAARRRRERPDQPQRGMHSHSR